MPLLCTQLLILLCPQVIPDVGLCVAFYDYVTVGQPFVYPGEGSSHQHVKFRVGKTPVVTVM